MNSCKVGRLSVVLAFAVAANTCGGTKGPASPTAPQPIAVSSVTVSGWLPPLRVGDTAHLTATAISSDGSSRIVTTEATWESSNVAVATVQAGQVTARAEGVAIITARFGSQAGTQTLTIERENIPPTGLSCGVERWAVKTLSDPAASRVELGHVRATTIRALNELPPRCSGLPSTRAFAEEFQVYEVVGRITYVKFQEDRDFHVVVADPAASEYSIVTEFADVACSGAIDSPYRDVLAGAKASFLGLASGQGGAVGATVRLRGVGFYDFNHGQVGRSRSCMELHPVILIERLQ